MPTSGAQPRDTTYKISPTPLSRTEFTGGHCRETMRRAGERFTMELFVGAFLLTDTAHLFQGETMRILSFDIGKREIRERKKEKKKIN